MADYAAGANGQKSWEVNISGRAILTLIFESKDESQLSRLLQFTAVVVHQRHQRHRFQHRSPQTPVACMPLALLYAAGC